MDDLAKLVESFQYQLQSDAGLIAREYLNSRGINQDTISDYRVGWCLGPITGEDGYRDKRWERRVIFPLIDEYSVPVALSGRMITYDYQDSIGNKYVLEVGTNRIVSWRSADGSQKQDYHKSKLHSSFVKSSFLFGLNVAKKHIIKDNYVVIAEGQFDVAILYQHGIKNVVGVLGSALTDHHINKLLRYCDLAIFLFDHDPAGLKFLKRAQSDITFDSDYVLLPEGYDPHQFVMEYGIQPIRDRIDQIIRDKSVSFDDRQKQRLNSLLKVD